MLRCPDRLNSPQRFQPVDAISLHAVAGTLQDPAHVARVVAHVRSIKPRLRELLVHSGRFGDVRDTETNFVLARPLGSPLELVRVLAQAGMHVKHCVGLGQDGWIRISVGIEAEHERLFELLTDSASHQEPTALSLSG